MVTATKFRIGHNTCLLLLQNMKSNTETSKDTTSHLNSAFPKFLGFVLLLKAKHLNTKSSH